MPTPKKGPRLGGSPAHQRLILSNLATAAVRARPDHHHRGQGAHAASGRGEADHQGEEGRPAQPSRGPQDHPRQVGRAHPLHRDRADLRRASGWLHPDHQDRSPQGRQRPDGGHRAGDRGVQPDPEGEARKKAAKKAAPKAAPVEEAPADEAPAEDGSRSRRLGRGGSGRRGQTRLRRGVVRGVRGVPRSPRRTRTPEPAYASRARHPGGGGPSSCPGQLGEQVAGVQAADTAAGAGQLARAVRWSSSLAGVGTPWSRPSSTTSPLR